jgi:hypothetical protein
MCKPGVEFEQQDCFLMLYCINAVSVYNVDFKLSNQLQWEPIKVEPNFIKRANI